MEETIAGFKRRGGWTAVVEHGERITRALRETGAAEEYPDAFSEWEQWRPKSGERIDEDVNEKTAEQASVDEGEGERAGKSPDEDLRSAGDRLTESYERIEEDDSEGAVDKWGESIGYVARAADSAGRKALRSVEGTVYRKVMTQLAPYYFDNELISANLQRTTRGGDAERFVFEVNVNDDGLKSEVSDLLAEYEDGISRWHVDTEKDVAVAEAAEGHEVTDAELEATTAVPEDERLEDAVDPATNGQRASVRDQCDEPATGDSRKELTDSDRDHEDERSHAIGSADPGSYAAMNGVELYDGVEETAERLEEERDEAQDDSTDDPSTDDPSTDDPSTDDPSTDDPSTD